MKTKYYPLLVILIFCNSLAQAQIKKGSLLFGGSLSYTKAEYETGNTSNSHMTGINPAFGFAIKQNLIAGIEYNYQSSLSEGYYKTKANRHYGGVFARRYWNLGKKFYVFGQGSLGAASQKDLFYDESHEVTLQRVRSLSVETSLRPGFAFSISRKVQLETMLMPVFTASYKSEKINRYEENPPFNFTTKKDFNISTDLGTISSFTIGIRFLLEK